MKTQTLALTVVAIFAACSEATRSIPEQRSAVRVESGGMTAEVTLERVVVTHSRGLRESGRWFGWEEASSACNVRAALVAKKEGADALSLGWDVETDPPKRLFMDDDTCKRRFADVKASGCAKDGLAVIDVDGARSAIGTAAGALFSVHLSNDSAPCDAAIAALPRAAVLAASSGAEGICPRLLAANDLEAATLCFVDYRSRVGSSVTKESLIQLVDAAGRGEQVSDNRAPWLAQITKGGEAEAALYAVLLAEPGLAKRVDLGENAAIALAFTPSRARRFEYLKRAMDRCRAGTFEPWQTQLAGVAAGAVDKALGQSVAQACATKLVAPDVWYGSRLK